MRTPPEKLTDLVRGVVESLGYELVGVELFNRSKSGQLLRVYIDQEKGITLDNCSHVSHQLSGVLDVEDPIHGHYDLEVSSPGLDRPLFTKEHFERFRGHKARLKMRSKIEGRRKFVGELSGVEGDSVLIRDDDVVYRLPLYEIDTARLVPEF